MKNSSSRDYRNLSRQPNLFVPVIKTIFACFMRLYFSFQLPSFVFCHHVCICFGCTHTKYLAIHGWNFLSLEKSKLQLIKLRVELRWHQDFIFFFVVIIVIIDLHLLITCCGNRYRNLQIPSNFCVIFTVRITDSKPFVQKNVVFHKVDVTQIKFKLPN